VDNIAGMLAACEAFLRVQSSQSSTYVESARAKGVELHVTNRSLQAHKRTFALHFNTMREICFSQITNILLHSVGLLELQ